MKNLLLASLLALTTSVGVTAADPPQVAIPAPVAPRPPPPPAPYSRCTIGWNTLLEIDDLTELPDQLPTGKLTLYANGAWNYVIWTQGKFVRADSGCLPDVQFEELVKLAKRLVAAPWTTHRPEFTCAAYSASYREFRINGKLVYTQRMCDGLMLDAKSQKVLADALAFVAPLTAP